MDSKEKTCCFSGHRDITATEYPDIAYQLELKIFDLISQGFTSFYDGGAIGFDTITESEEGVITYGNPIRIPGAVSINISPEGELAPFRADGGVYLMSRTNNGYKGDMELAKIPESFEKDCIGVSVHATDKTVIENNTDNVKPFALLFEFAGDVKEIKHVLYYCYADRVAVEGDNPDKREGKAEKLSLTAMPRPDSGIVKAKTGDETTTAVADGWYTAVYEPTVAE